MEGIGLSPGAWGALFLREYQQDSRHFLSCQAWLGYAPRTQTHLKKPLYHTHPVGVMYEKYWQIPTSSQRWAGAHFGRPCWSVHGSGRVCLGSAGSRARPSDMDPGKPAFMSGVPRPVSSSFWGPCSRTLTLFEGATFIAWHLRHPFLEECRRGKRHFWSHQSLQPYHQTHLKRALCHTRPVSWTYDKYRLPPSSRTWQFRTDTSTCRINNL